jgi:hypothetical protein
MTSFSDDIRQGRAVYARAVPPATGYAEDEIRGVPHTQEYAYQMGAVSTALATGIFYTASGATGGTLTSTGPLVSGGVATLTPARGVRMTASVDLSAVTVTFNGTDHWGASLTASILGPTGNTLGNVGSYRDSLSVFKTITSISGSATFGTTAVYIGDNNTYGVPYKLTNIGRALDVYIDGSTATVPSTWAAGLATTVTAGATTADVRGTVTLSTVVLANGTRFITAKFITPNNGIAAGSDTKEITYGDAPYSA